MKKVYTAEVEQSRPIATKSTRVWVAFAMVATIALLGTMAWVLYYAFGRPAWETQSLETTLTSGGNPAAAEEDTSELCAVADCEQAWRTDFGNYLLFPSEGLADYWATAIGGDVVRNGTIVLDRNSFHLDQEERAFSIDLLFPARDW